MIPAEPALPEQGNWKSNLSKTFPARGTTGGCELPNETKIAFLAELRQRYGELRKLDGSQSLFDVGATPVRVYVRYSKIHDRNNAFFGLRKDDLRRLEGHPSVICFLWDRQSEPLVVPFSQFEDVFQSVPAANDGQYKAQLFLEEGGTALHIVRAGRFNVESYLGWRELELMADSSKAEHMPELSHTQIQTLLGAIGIAKGQDIWIPPENREGLDWSLTDRFQCRSAVPFGYDSVRSIIQEVDVLWIQRGTSDLSALFEVEHSTPVYSGLLRFNDIHLVAPSLKATFSIVANSERRSLFVRQLNRPTFKVSGISDLCSFLEYANVLGWHRRIKNVP